MSEIYNLEYYKNKFSVTANQTSIDNSTSGLSANNVQGAIDELKGTIGYSKKNLIPYPYNNTTKTLYGIEWTDNGDGRVYANGLATNVSAFEVQSRLTSPMSLKRGTYCLTGCPSNNPNNKYSIFVVATNEDNQDGREFLAYDYGKGAVFTLEKDCDSIGVQIQIANGSEADNVVFEPMIRYASIQDDTFVPYVEDVNTRLQHYNYLDIKDKISKSSNCHSIDYAYVKNGSVYIGGFISTSAVATSTTWLFVINDVKYLPIHKVWGRFSYSTSSDFDKIVNINIENNTGYVALLNTLSNVVAFEFSYPIK